MGSHPGRRVSIRRVLIISLSSYPEMGLDDFSDIVPQFLPRDWASFPLVVLGRDLVWCLTRDWNAEKRENNRTCLDLSLPDRCPIN